MISSQHQNFRILQLLSRNVGSIIPGANAQEVINALLCVRNTRNVRKRFTFGTLFDAHISERTVSNWTLLFFCEQKQGIPLLFIGKSTDFYPPKPAVRNFELTLKTGRLPFLAHLYELKERVTQAIIHKWRF